MDAKPRARAIVFVHPQGRPGATAKFGRGLGPPAELSRRRLRTWRHISHGGNSSLSQSHRMWKEFCP